MNMSRMRDNEKEVETMGLSTSVEFENCLFLGTGGSEQQRGEVII